MITFIELGDVDAAAVAACEKINEEIADFASKSGKVEGMPDFAMGIASGQQAAKHRMLLTLAERCLISSDVFRRLFDERVGQIEERCLTRR